MKSSGLMAPVQRVDVPGYFGARPRKTWNTRCETDTRQKDEV